MPRNFYFSDQNRARLNELLMDVRILSWQGKAKTDDSVCMCHIVLKLLVRFCAPVSFAVRFIPAHRTLFARVIVRTETLPPRELTLPPGLYTCRSSKFCPPLRSGVDISLEFVRFEVSCQQRIADSRIAFPRWQFESQLVFAWRTYATNPFVRNQ